MALPKKVSKILTDYCENTSLVGLGYISNRKIHLTERIFWLICIIISAGGSYYLIREYQNTFETKAISLVMEATRPQDKAQFPAVGVCEDGSVLTGYSHLKDFIKELGEKDGITEYNYDVEDYLLRIIFPNMYSAGSLAHYCKPYFDQTEFAKCPTTGYRELATLVRKNCSELITYCAWNDKVFDCCHYFLPLQTPNGRCFVMNSIQTTIRNGPHWLKGEIGWDAGNGELKLHFSNPVELHILNAEDIPAFLVEDNLYHISSPGMEQDLQLTVQEITNDLDIRDISSEYRKCRFSDENFKDSAYKYYSFTSCITDCLKELQLESCGCISYNYLVNDNDKTKPCDYDGFLCLDRQDLLHPRPSIMQPWRSNGLVCKCLPSCSEHEISVFHAFSSKGNKTTRKVRISQSVATQRFRRQAVRTRLDVVVTIGGILGLFMGASILSLIEIFYFFFVRVFYLKI